MGKGERSIIIILAILLLLTSLGIWYNRQYAREQAALLVAAEILVMEYGQERTRLILEIINNLKVVEFTGQLKSSVMKKPEEHIYTGVPLAELLESAGISWQGKQRVVVRSIDGYAVALKVKEIKGRDNIYLIFKDQGKYLSSYGTKDGQGPYMIVIRGDSFSQRWAKYVCELDVQ